MKNAWLVVITGLLACLPALANSSALRSRDYSCADLRELLQREGTLEIRLLIGSQKYYSEPVYCPSLQVYAEPAYVSTSDKCFCQVGYLCSAPDAVSRTR